ncbi:hypothetical protein DERF_015769 [Dermatophagoides farinae]|uniref:Uncharacterized protein n=1 Tax=Dermatophagoides farinae TaxID=6954 RepID=A0A922HL89_DERFA|nr:hypothetical protein DERF_015769 [Dermatophagoides farinae]
MNEENIIILYKQRIINGQWSNEWLLIVELNKRKKEKKEKKKEKIMPSTLWINRKTYLSFHFISFWIFVSTSN